MNETTTETTTTTSKTPLLFWALALVALGIGIYFIFFTDKVNTQQNITIPDGSVVTIDGLPTDDSTVVATVNGMDVTQGQVNELINSDLISRNVNFSDLSEAEQTQLQSSSVELMIDYTLLLQAAQNANTEVDRAETEAQVAQLKTQFTEEEFANQLAQLKVTEERLTDTIHNGRLIDTFIQNNILIETSVATEAEIDAELADIIEQNGGEAAFTEQLTTVGMTMDSVRDSVAQGLAAEKDQAKIEAYIDGLRTNAAITRS